MKSIYIFSPFLLLLTSCAIMRDHVTIRYKPVLNSVVIEDALHNPVTVCVTDIRDNKAVGCKRNEYGMECAYIMAENDAAEVLKNAVEIELQNRGFSIVDDGVVINIEFCKFYNNFEIEFLAAKACSEAIMHIVVKKNEKIQFSSTIVGLANEDCFFMGGRNAVLSLNAALYDAVQKVVNNPQFINSLLKNND